MHLLNTFYTKIFLCPVRRYVFHPLYYPSRVLPFMWDDTSNLDETDSKPFIYLDWISISFLQVATYPGGIPLFFCQKNNMSDEDSLFLSSQECSDDPREIQPQINQSRVVQIFASKNLKNAKVSQWECRVGFGREKISNWSLGLGLSRTFMYWW